MNRDEAILETVHWLSGDRDLVAGFRVSAPYVQAFDSPCSFKLVAGPSDRRVWLLRR